MDPPPVPPPDQPSDSRIKKPLRKRPKTRIRPTLFEVPRARNCGADDSFLSTEKTGMMDMTCGGSDTEEEDMTEIEEEYLNRMAIDTNRPVETVFGKGVKVWKSFSGSGRIYTDLEDHIKRQQRAEYVYKDYKKKLGIGAGGKRKRAAIPAGGWTLGFEGQPSGVQYDSEMEYSMQVKAPAVEETLNEKQPLPDPNTPQAYTDGNITYPDLPALTENFVVDTGLELPPSPKESEWNKTFNMSMSEVEDIREPIPAPDTLTPEQLRQAFNENMFPCGSAGSHPAGNTNRSVQSTPARRRRRKRRALQFADEETRDVPMTTSDDHASSSTAASTGMSSGAYTRSLGTGVTTPSSSYKKSTPADNFMAFAPRKDPTPSTGRLGFLSSLAGGARRTVSDSFGGPGDGPVDRFDERAYRLGQKGDGEQKADKGKGKAEDGNEGGKPNLFKGRPWLKKV